MGAPFIVRFNLWPLEGDRDGLIDTIQCFLGPHDPKIKGQELYL